MADHRAVVGAVLGGLSVCIGELRFIVVYLVRALRVDEVTIGGTRAVALSSSADRRAETAARRRFLATSLTCQFRHGWQVKDARPIVRCGDVLAKRHRAGE